MGQNGSLTFVSRARRDVQSRESWLDAAVIQGASCTTKDIGGNLSSLRIASQNELRIRTLFCISSHLGVSRNCTIISSLAI